MSVSPTSGPYRVGSHCFIVGPTGVNIATIFEHNCDAGAENATTRLMAASWQMFQLLKTIAADDKCLIGIDHAAEITAIVAQVTVGIDE